MKLRSFLLPSVLLLSSNLAYAASYLDDVPNDIWSNVFCYTFGFQPTIDVRREDLFLYTTLQRVDVGGKRMLWFDALEEHQGAPILDDCAQPNHILKSLPSWDHEVKQASMYGAEPAYLKTIGSLAAIKIRQFIAGRESTLVTQADLVQHAYRVLFVMKAFNNSAWTVAYNAAVDSACDAAWFSAYSAAYHAAMGAPSTAAMAAVAGVCQGAMDSSSKGKLAYRLAEKASLLYFAQHAEAILPAAYNAASAELAGIPAKNIFASYPSWDAFKSEHFGRLLPNQIHFLATWLGELDRIAKKIAGMNG